MVPLLQFKVHYKACRTDQSSKLITPKIFSAPDRPISLSHIETTIEKSLHDRYTGTHILYIIMMAKLYLFLEIGLEFALWNIIKLI